MNVISTVAWSLVLLLAGVWTWFRIQRWWAERRLYQIRDEVVDIARKVGIPETELRCPHGTIVGDECARCERGNTK